MKKIKTTIQLAISPSSSLSVLFNSVAANNEITYILYFESEIKTALGFNYTVLSFIQTWRIIGHRNNFSNIWLTSLEVLCCYGQTYRLPPEARLTRLVT